MSKGQVLHMGLVLDAVGLIRDNKNMQKKKKKNL